MFGILTFVNYVIGIDEAGRGALAGPVCVGAVLFPEDFNWKEAFALITKRGEPKLRDSKKLSAQQRDILFTYITEHGRLRHATGLVSADTIDSIGIVSAAHEATSLAIRGLGVTPTKTKVLLDAGLRAPSAWEQESFVRGDENIPAIAFASIVAKVTRDRFMEELAGRYEMYGFAQHKGYGTSFHMTALRHEGLSDIHRRSFCGGLQSAGK